MSSSEVVGQLEGKLIADVKSPSERDNTLRLGSVGENHSKSLVSFVVVVQQTWDRGHGIEGSMNITPQAAKFRLERNSIQPWQWRAHLGSKHYTMWIEGASLVGRWKGEASIHCMLFLHVNPLKDCIFFVFTIRSANSILIILHGFSAF